MRDVLKIPPAHEVTLVLSGLQHVILHGCILQDPKTCDYSMYSANTIASVSISISISLTVIVDCYLLFDSHVHPHRLFTLHK